MEKSSKRNYKNVKSISKLSKAKHWSIGVHTTLGWDKKNQTMRKRQLN